MAFSSFKLGGNRSQRSVNPRPLPVRDTRIDEVLICPEPQRKLALAGPKAGKEQCSEPERVNHSRCGSRESRIKYRSFQGGQRATSFWCVVVSITHTETEPNAQSLYKESSAEFGFHPAWPTLDFSRHRCERRDDATAGRFRVSPMAGNFPL